MSRQTLINVEADIVIRHRETAKEETLTVRGIECTWNWDEGSRDAAEYWAVADWAAETFGNSIDWFSIKCVVGSPCKQEEKTT